MSLTIKNVANNVFSKTAHHSAYNKAQLLHGKILNFPFTELQPQQS